MRPSTYKPKTPADEQRLHQMRCVTRIKHPAPGRLGWRVRIRLLHAGASDQQQPHKDTFFMDRECGTRALALSAAQAYRDQAVTAPWAYDGKHHGPSFCRANANPIIGVHLKVSPRTLVDGTTQISLTWMAQAQIPGCRGSRAVLKGYSAGRYGYETAFVAAVLKRCALIGALPPLELEVPLPQSKEHKAVARAMGLELPSIGTVAKIRGRRLTGLLERRHVRDQKRQTELSAP